MAAMNGGHASNEVEELKREAKEVAGNDGMRDVPATLRLIDAVHRLGIAQHFQEELHRAFRRVLPSAAASDLDLFHTSLQFRLLRQHSFPVTPVVFNKFMDANGKFIEHLVEDNHEGLLSLYEASFLGFSGEQVLANAKSFSSNRLKLLLQQNKLQGNLLRQVQLSLQIPLHRRMPRVEARNMIEMYLHQDRNIVNDNENNTQLLLLVRLAKLEYNITHHLYMEELQELTKWWTDVKKGKQKVRLARDCLIESMFWATGTVPEPEFSKGRKSLAKFAVVTTVIDDIYETHHSLDDLEKLTEAAYQWDMKAADALPEQIKQYYKAMVVIGDEAASNAMELVDMDIDFRHYIKEQWATYLSKLLVETKWMKQGDMPKFNDYMRNGWVSIAGPLSFVYSLLAEAPLLKQHDLRTRLDNWADSDLFYWPCFISRLANDLKVTKEEIDRGEPSAVDCYMMEHNVPFEEAKARVREVLNGAWTKLVDMGAPESGMPTPLLTLALNMARTAERIYLHDNFFSVECQENQDCIVNHLLSPIN